MKQIKAVIFDAGDTVLRVHPEYSGPMVDWPELTPVSGIAEALVTLRGVVKLGILSNAQESTNAQIAGAMRRAGLDGYFDFVLTAREAGAAKPDPAFFAAALRRAGVSAGEAVMVGDYYEVDVVGGKGAGMRAVWYNPAGEPCPSAEPAYDGELRDLRALPGLLGLAPIQEQPGLGGVSPAVRGLRLPDLPTCFEWLRAGDATDDLLEHVRLVGSAAFRLAERLRAAGETVDPLLAHRGGLLHDLAKAPSTSAGVSHELAAGRILVERGFDDLAAIAERHPVWAPLNPDQAPRTWEEKLVYYADRIAEASGIVSIDERMAAMLRRRPERAADVPAYTRAAHDMEEAIASRLDLPAGALVGWLRSAVRR